jgi:hypothetical protein
VRIAFGKSYELISSALCLGTALWYTPSSIVGFGFDLILCSTLSSNNDFKTHLSVSSHICFCKKTAGITPEQLSIHRATALTAPVVINSLAPVSGSTI